jgi:hypothetical protein
LSSERESKWDNKRVSKVWKRDEWNKTKQFCTSPKWIFQVGEKNDGACFAFPFFSRYLSCYVTFLTFHMASCMYVCMYNGIINTIRVALIFLFYCPWRRKSRRKRRRHF